MPCGKQWMTWCADRCTQLNHLMAGCQGLSHEAVSASSIFSGDEEIFAFARAVSRLHEMGSKRWAETVHHAQV
jgi:hypothetical protein